MRTFSGIWPALVTPFTPDDQVNTAMLRTLVEHFIGRGLDGLYLCGSTGEGVFMSVEERELVAETVVAQVAGRIPVIVHVGAAALRDAERLARHSQAISAAGISAILPPVTYDPRSVVTHFEGIAAAAPALPFLPYLFGYTRDAVALMHDLAHIPNLAGTKYTGPNMHEMSRLIAWRDRAWTVMAGMDEQAILAALYGAHGAIGSTINLMPGVYQAIYRHVRAGDPLAALALQKRANAVTETLISLGFTGAFKEALRLIGFDCGLPRRPNIPLPEAKRGELAARLEAVGFAELASM